MWGGEKESVGGGLGKCVIVWGGGLYFFGYVRRGEGKVWGSVLGCGEMGGGGGVRKVLG